MMDRRAFVRSSELTQRIAAYRTAKQTLDAALDAAEEGHPSFDPANGQRNYEQADRLADATFRAVCSFKPSTLADIKAMSKFVLDGLREVDVIADGHLAKFLASVQRIPVAEARQ